MRDARDEKCANIFLTKWYFWKKKFAVTNIFWSYMYNYDTMYNIACTCTCMQFQFNNRIVVYEEHLTGISWILTWPWGPKCCIWVKSKGPEISTLGFWLRTTDGRCLQKNTNNNINIIEKSISVTLSHVHMYIYNYAQIDTLHTT